MGVYVCQETVRVYMSVTAGGRVLCVTALAGDHRAARDRAYEAVEQVAFDGAFFRKDIAHRVLK